MGKMAAPLGKPGLGRERAQGSRCKHGEPVNSPQHVCCKHGHCISGTELNQTSQDEPYLRRVLCQIYRSVRSSATLFADSESTVPTINHFTTSAICYYYWCALEALSRSIRQQPRKDRAQVQSWQSRSQVLRLVSLAPGDNPVIGPMSGRR